MDERNEKLLRVFQSSEQRELEENFARTLAEDETVRLFFVNGEGAWTDGRNVVVDPAHNGIFCDRHALDKIQDFLGWPPVVLVDAWNVLRLITRSQTIHECLHLLYTDFPPAARCDPACDTRNKRKVMSLIANIIEDAYIENVGCSCYDRMELYLKFGRVADLFATNPGHGTAEQVLMGTRVAQQAPGAEADKGQTMIRQLTEYLDYMAGLLLYPMVKLPQPQAEIAPYVEKTQAFFLDGSMAAAPAERYAQASAAFRVIEPLIPPDAQALDTGETELLLGGARTHQGGASIGGNARKGKTQAVALRLFLDASGRKREGEVPIGQLMQMLETFAQEKELTVKFVTSVARTVSLRGDELGSAVHRGIRVVEHHPGIDQSRKRAYYNICRKYYTSIRSYAGRFAQLVQAHAPEREERQRFGKGIASRMLGDPKRRFWYRLSEGTAVPDLAILLLIDGSGSMDGERCRAARESAVILHEVLASQGIPHAIVEHRAKFDRPEVDVSILVDFDAHDDEKYNLLRIRADDNTRDGLALPWAARYLEQQTTNEHRVILVLSDGLPEHMYDRYLPPVSTKDTENAVRKIRKRGIGVIAVSLDAPGAFDCYDSLSEIYPNLIACNDLRQLAGQLLRVIAKLLV